MHACMNGKTFLEPSRLKKDHVSFIISILDNSLLFELFPQIKLTNVILIFKLLFESVKVVHFFYFCKYGHI